MLQFDPVLLSFSIVFTYFANIGSNTIVYMNLSQGSSPCWEGD